MFSKWFNKKKTNETKIDSEPANIHPSRNRTADKNPAIVKPKIEPKPIEVKTKNSALSPKEIHDLRQSEFEQLGIPYNMVLIAEARGIRGINPNNLASETNDINAKLITFGFNIKISYLESFECQLLYLDYQKLREANQRTKGVILPGHSLINIIVLREAEKIIRKKYQLTENPTTGEIAKKFQSEVKSLFELLWNKSMEYQLKQQAQRRIRRERNLHTNEPLIEADVIAMMEKIKAERANPTK